MGDDKKLVPRLRFKGTYDEEGNWIAFTDAWEQRKLDEVISELKSGLSRQLDNTDIGLPVVRANNINDGKLDMDNDVKYWYRNDPQGADTSKYLIHKNDILINFINSEAKMGTATIVDTEPNRDTIYTTNILKMRTDDTVIDSLFLLYLTMTYHYCNYIKVITKPAVNQASFTTVDYKNYSFLMPSLDEQKKIGEYFNNLDNIITLHQRKCDTYKKMKKGMMQKLFNQEVRFKKDDGSDYADWNEKSLGEVADIFAGGTPSTSKPEYWNGDVNWMCSGAIQNCYIYENDKTIERKITQEGLAHSSAKMIKANSVVLAMTGATCGNVGYLTFETSGNQSVMAFEVYADYDSKYLYYIMLHNRTYILSYKSDGVQGGINKSTAAGLIFEFPSDIEEQTKIANCLAEFDNLIDASERRLESYKKLKKAMLQKMFC